MLILRYVARPRSDNPTAGKYAGAYINCWVSTASRAEARVVARKEIRAAGWLPETCEEVTEVERSDFNAKPTSLASYDVAARMGWAMTIHTWPKRRSRATAGVRSKKARSKGS